jgi:hypothetical protein
MNDIAEAIRTLAVYGLIAVFIPYLYRVLRILIVSKIVLDACKRISELAKKDLSPAGAGHTQTDQNGPGPQTPPAPDGQNAAMGAEGHTTSSEEPS